MMKKQVLSAGLFVVAAILAASAVLFPSVSLVSVFSSSLVCIFSVIFSSNLWVIGIGSLVTFILAWVLSGSASAALLFLILFLPIGVALGLGFRNKWSFNESISYAVLNASVLGVLAIIVFIGEFSGGSFDVKAVLEPVFLSFKDLLRSAFVIDDPSVNAFYGAMGYTAEQYVDRLYYSIVYSLPTFFVCFILLVSVICYWLIKFFFKRTTVQVDFMGRFDDCRIGRTGAILYSLATLFYLFSSHSVFGIVVLNFSNIMTYVLAYAGISFIAYLLDFKNFSQFFKVGIIIASIAVCIIPGGLLNIIALLGFLDSCWNFRERLKNSGY
ncbi:MAG: DUF2232 domain-containing protein [Ruminococcaceae bacterium]|nr:DUF2232 domain-containing protein [Oscillospiraceae bacterium]